jgi:hypothetical protein
VNGKKEEQMLQLAAALAVGAAAVAFVVGFGAYLHIRFTQHLDKPPGDEKPPPRP